MHTYHAHVYPCTHVHTDAGMHAKIANLSSLLQSPLGPAWHQGTCSVGGTCWDTGGSSCPAAQLWLGKRNTCSESQGSKGINSAFPFSQAQQPSPRFSSWGGEGGDLPSMKGKTLMANASGGQVSLCQMNTPTPGPPGRGVRGSLVWERTRLQAGL